MQNKLHLGERLLCRAKAADCEGQEHMRDCVYLECLRDNPTRLIRIAHGCVLEESSDFFIEMLQEAERSGNTKRGRPLLLLEISADIIDLLLEYIYTNQLIQIPARHAVHLVAAAKQIQMRSLSDQLNDYFNEHLRACLLDPEFLDASRHTAEDVACLGEILGNMCLCGESTGILVGRIRQWVDSDPLSKGQVGGTLIDKLHRNLLSDIGETGPDPLGERGPRIGDCASLNVFRRQRSFMKRSHKRTGELNVYIASSNADGSCRLLEISDGVSKDVERGDNWPIDDIMYNLTALRLDELFVVESHGLVVMDSKTGSIMRTLNPSCGRNIRGMTTFEDELLIWTRSGDLYLLDRANDDTGLTKIVATNHLFDGENTKNLRILKWDERTLEFVCVDARKMILRRLVSNARGKIVSDTELFRFVNAKGILPIGTNGVDATVFVACHESHNNLFLIGVHMGNQCKRTLVSSKCWYIVDAIKSGNLAFVTLITVAARWELLLINLDTHDKSTFELGSAKDRVVLIPVITRLYCDEVGGGDGSSRNGTGTRTRASLASATDAPDLTPNELETVTVDTAKGEAFSSSSYY